MPKTPAPVEDAISKGGFWYHAAATDRWHLVPHGPDHWNKVMWAHDRSFSDWERKLDGLASDPEWKPINRKFRKFMTETWAELLTQWTTRYDNPATHAAPGHGWFANWEFYARELDRARREAAGASWRPAPDLITARVDRQAVSGEAAPSERRGGGGGLVDVAKVVAIFAVVVLPVGIMLSKRQELKQIKAEKAEFHRLGWDWSQRFR